MSEAFDAIVEGLRAAITDGRATGGAVAVLADGRIETMALGEGWRDAPGVEPTAPIYSITKTFIAVAVLRLLRRNGRSLDTAVARWHPGVPGSEAFTVRQLLNHTAGIRDYGPLSEYHQAVARSPSEPWTRDGFAEHTWRLGLGGEPGEGFVYANPGYRLLVEIAEREANEPFAAVLDRQVLVPAAISGTHLVDEPDDLAACAPAGSRLLHREAMVRDARCYHPGWVFHGLLVSSPGQVVKLFDAIDRGELLHPDDRRALLFCVPVSSPHPRVVPGYGLGVMADRRAPGRCFGHGGGGPGWLSAAWHLATDVGSASLCALLASESDPVADALVFDAAERAGLAPPRPG